MKWLLGSHTLALGFAGLLPYAVLVATPPKTAAKVSYSRDIAPILKTHCESCHSGPYPAGGLGLTGREGIVKGGKSGTLIASNLEKSLLIRRITGAQGPQMPMGLSPLSAADQAKIKEWVVEGMPFDAPAPKHWAYVAPVPPKIPDLHSAWVRNPIDAFVLKEIRANGLHPSPEASRETLIRRVTLDLTGLLPTPREVHEFVADRSPNAYEKVVDRLLASPHYGERQAREWLDLARYADSDGYEKDLNRNNWLYRDWVIDAFNRNEPFDRFTIDQIAGDLLPNSTLQQKVATGFQRNTMFNREGGVDQEEAHFMVELDRAEVTSTVWLGTTLNCCRCHDHKYDPFTQKDYYKMVAFYNNTAVYPRGPKSVGEEKWFEASLKVPDSQQTAALESLKQRAKDLDSRLNSQPTAAEVANWIAASRVPVEWTVVKPTSVSGDKTDQPTVGDDGTVMIAGAPVTDRLSVSLPAMGRPYNSLKLEVLPDPSLPHGGPGRAPNGNFVLSDFRLTGAKPRFAAADYVQEGYDPLNCLTDSGNVWAIHGAEGTAHRFILDLDHEVPAGQAVTLELGCQSEWQKHTIGKFRLSVADHPEATTDLIPASARASDQELAKFYLSHNPDRAQLRVERTGVQQNLDRLEAQVPEALVMEEKPRSGPLVEYIRHRGEFGSKTELVEAGTPAVLNPLPPGRHDRLALAKWLVSRDNPLTARVQVNRMWEQLFGRGIVETAEDFGTRGSPPSNQPLLDYLACRFMNQGWDMKAINRLIVTSSTYRQSSDATPGLLAKDPGNILLARGPRFRMEAEMIHDVALDAGGLLSLKIGGPSVYPYQPDGIWDTPYNSEAWMPSKGEDAYRRGLYTFWKRSSTYPFFTAFDATSREECTVRRIRTNTPLQALALLNDKLMMAAAEGLGKRMESGGRTLPEQLRKGFEICTSRDPTPRETARLEKLEGTLEKLYGTEPKEAIKLGGSARDAAFAMVGNVLLNLDETITKG